MKKFDLNNIDLAAAVATLYAREELKELRARYAWHAARAEYQELANLYIEDGIFEVSRPGNVFSLKGRGTIAEHLKGSLKPGLVFPTTHNHVIDIVGDEAFGTSMMSSHSQTQYFSGRYHDHFHKVDGTWFFAARRFSYYMPEFEPSPRGIDGRLPPTTGI